jgi:hypothetical protein
MSDGYKPRRGSLAEKVIAHLQKKPKPLNTEQINELFGAHRTGVRANLSGAIAAGILEVAHEGNKLLFSLAQPAAAAADDGALTIATWSDGDVSIAGGTANEDGSMTYSRAQLLQLIRFVMTPAIGMPVHSEVAVPALINHAQE